MNYIKLSIFVLFALSTFLFAELTTTTGFEYPDYSPGCIVDYKYKLGNYDLGWGLVNNDGYKYENSTTSVIVTNEKDVCALHMAVITDDEAKAGEQSLKLEQDARVKSDIFSVPYSDYNGKLAVSFFVKTGSNSGLSSFDLTNLFEGEDTATSALVWGEKLYYTSGYLDENEERVWEYKDSGCPVNDNKWYWIKIDQDYSANTWDLYIDGILRNTESAIGFKDILSAVELLGVRSGGEGPLYIDEVDVDIYTGDLKDPRCHVSTTELNFGCVEKESSSTLSLDITNFGLNNNLMISSTDIDNTAFSVDTSSLPTIGPGKTKSLPITFNPSEKGEYTATMTLNFSNHSSIGVALVGYSEYACNLRTKVYYETIQDAIDGAEHYDEIVVYPGTYTDTGTIDFSGKAITVRSVDPEDPEVVAATIIDGSSADHVVTFQTGEGADSILSGLTITGGNANSTGFDDSGAGVYCNGASPTIKHCVIEGNTASQYGGGIYVFDGSPVISNCIIRDNTATVSGGGIAGGKDISIKNSLIYGNEATSSGGAIYNSWGEIANCTIANNSAYTYGGIYSGEYYWSRQAFWTLDETSGTNASDSSGNGNDATLVNGVGWMTEGQVNGAAIFYGTDDYIEAPCVLNPADGSFSAFCWVQNASWTLGQGQGIISQLNENNNVCVWLNLNNNGQLATTLKTSSSSSLISDYTGLTDGEWHRIGVVWDAEVKKRYLYADGVIVKQDDVSLNEVLLSSSNPVILGAQDKNNNQSGYWEGLIDDVRIYQKSEDESPLSLEVTNSIVWGNSDDDSITTVEQEQISVPFAAITVGYSCVEGWTSGGTGNINDDPEFVDEESDDYNLTPISPCIDAGNADRDYAGQKDIAGDGRVIDGDGDLADVVDMGADEYNPLIAYWKMDTPGSNRELLAKEEINGNNGILEGGPQRIEDSERGRCLEFDGVDDYVETNSCVLNPSDGSFSAFCWIYLDLEAGDNSQTIIQQLDDTSGIGRTWLYRKASDDKLYSYLGGVDTVPTSSNNISFQIDWYHVGLVYDKDKSTEQLTLYINGTVAGSSTITNMESCTGGLRIGCHKTPSTSDAYWNGLIDDVRIYDSALSLTSILALSQGNSITEEPTAHWDFEEDSLNHHVLDITRNGNDAILKGGPEWTANGTVFGAVELDGIDDYIEAPCVLNPADGSFSAFCWVRYGGSTQGILSQWDGGSNVCVWLNSNSSGQLATTLQSDSSGALISQYAGHTDGDWHHVGLVWDASDQKRYLYADGKVVAQDQNSIVGNLRSSTNALILGAQKSDLGYWSGKIDDVRIYNRVQTPYEVRILSKAPVAYWKLDETSGSDASDSSYNEYDATLVGDAAWTTGRINGAVILDGTGDYIEAPCVLDPADGSFSAFCWIYLNQEAGINSQTIIQQLTDTSNNTGRTWLYRKMSDDKLYSYLGGVSTVSDTIISVNQWYHVGLVYNDSTSTLRLYINGAETGSSGISSMGTCEGGLRIGRHRNTSDLTVNADWNGLIDDVRVYNRVLSEDEIEELAGL